MSDYGTHWWLDEYGGNAIWYNNDDYKWHIGPKFEVEKSVICSMENKMFMAGPDLDDFRSGYIKMEDGSWRQEHQLIDIGEK